MPERISRRDEPEKSRQTWKKHLKILREAV
jgi:hypothetical protein